MRATCGVAEICKAFENLVELEEERVGGIIVHLGTAAAALFDVFPAVKNSWLYLIVDHAGDESVLLLEDVPVLRIWTKDLEQPFFRRTFRIQSMDIRSKAEI